MAQFYSIDDADKLFEGFCIKYAIGLDVTCIDIVINYVMVCISETSLVL